MSNSKRNVRNLPIAYLTILLISSTVFEQGLAQTYVVWEDDFNDGDYDEWTVEGGGFAIVNGSLVCQLARPWPSLATVYHESPGAYGNWSFDIKGAKPSVWFIASSPNHRNVTGYRFARVMDDNINHFFGLYRVVNGQETRLAYSTTTNETGRNWHHVEVRRDIEGEFTVSLNGSHIMRITDENITTSTYFVFGGYSPGDTIDNVVVDSVVISTPTETISTTPEPVEQDLIVYVIVSALLVTSVIFIAEVQKRRQR